MQVRSHLIQALRAELAGACDLCAPADEEFAATLLGQWRGVIANGLLQEVSVPVS